MDQPRFVGGRIKGTQLAAAAFVMSLVLLLAVGGITVYVLAGKSDEGSETHEAVCALTADLERRTDEAREFLETHPHGLPGIASVSQIRESTRNQERTLAALSVVSC